MQFGLKKIREAFYKIHEPHELQPYIRKFIVWPI